MRVGRRGMRRRRRMRRRRGGGCGEWKGAGGGGEGAGAEPVRADGGWGSEWALREVRGGGAVQAARDGAVSRVPGRGADARPGTV